MAKYLAESGLQELMSLLKKYVNEEISSLDLDLFIVVTTLPTTGVANKIYLVPAGTTENQNIYAEYIWVNDAWEKLGEVQIETDLSNYYTKDETYSKSEVDSFVNGLLSHEIDEYNFNATSPLNLTGSYDGSSHTLTISGSIDAASSTTDGYMSSSDKSKLDSLDTSKVVQSASATGTSPLTLAASISNGALTITGSVDAYSKSEIDNTVAALEEEMSELSGGAVSTVNASGTAPLTLSASKSGTTVNITGSVDLSSYATTSDVNSSVSNLESEISSKQDALTAGSNITISNNTISATVPTKTSDLTNDSGYITSADIPDTPTLSDLGGVGTVNASGTSPLTLSASKSGTTVTISGSVSEATTSSSGLMSASDKATLDSISGAVTSASASGTSPLTLSASVSNGALTITGSIAASSSSANGYMTSTQYTQLANLVSDPLQYATEITAADVDTMWENA